MKLKRLRAFLLFLLIAVLFTACLGDAGAGRIIKYDITQEITNLDPQFATDETARMIISNTFEGLFRQMPDGSIEKAATRDYTISQDALTYTFYLREDAFWTVQKRDEEAHPVIAPDFVFAFSRIFNPNTPSPFASQFMSIANAQQVLKQELPISALGVKALNDYTLQITLSRPETLFPALLASTGAMPCQEQFFISTRARYGLEKSALNFNGPFHITSWNNDRSISLRANSSYTGEKPIPAGVELVIPSVMAKTEAADFVSDPQERFLAGTTDACKIEYDRLNAVRQNGDSIVSFEDTVWVLALNSERIQLADIDIRRAIAYSIDRSLFHRFLPENLRATATLIPPAIMLGGESYRLYAGESSLQVYSPDLAQRSFRKGQEDLPDDVRGGFREILICDNTDQGMLAGLVQRTVQQELATPIGLLKLSEQELMRRVRAGEYEAAIIPISADYASPESILLQFKSDSQLNIVGFQNEQYDNLLTSAASASVDEQKDLFHQGEQLLLAECAIIPLYFETTYYAMKRGVSNIGFSPFLSGMHFEKTRKVE